MDHLTNCHGEWLYLIQVLGLLPFVGAWVRHLTRPMHQQHKDNL